LNIGEFAEKFAEIFFSFFKSINVSLSLNGSVRIIMMTPISTLHHLRCQRYPSRFPYTLLLFSTV